MQSWGVACVSTLRPCRSCDGAAGEQQPARGACCDWRRCCRTPARATPLTTRPHAGPGAGAAGTAATLGGRQESDGPDGAARAGGRLLRITAVAVCGCERSQRGPVVSQAKHTSTHMHSQTHTCQRRSGPTWRAPSSRRRSPRSAAGRSISGWARPAPAPEGGCLAGAGCARPRPRPWAHASGAGPHLHQW